MRFLFQFDIEKSDIIKNSYSFFYNVLLVSSVRILIFPFITIGKGEIHFITMFIINLYMYRLVWASFAFDIMRILNI